MSRHPALYQWTDELASHFDGLPPVFVSLLAAWSLGMILARRCGLDSVAGHLARLRGQKANTVRQRLREFYQEAPAKAGAKHGCRRRDFAVVDCFVPLLRWVLSLWSCPRLALALDVTNLGDRFHVLCVSVLYGGIGIPVAWKIVRANQPEPWHPHWCALLQCLRPAMPADWLVVVLGDRGLESPRLFQEITALGWHPLLRVKAAGKFRPAGWVRWYRFGSLVPRVGQRFAAAGDAYQTAKQPLACTLLACWAEGHAAPWLLLTDLEPPAASPCWYAFRAWVEQGFKVIKGGVLHWQHTRMTKPERAERLWLAIAVTLLWLVVLGAQVEADERRETLGKTPPAARRQRLFTRGLAEWLAAQLSGRPLLHGKLPPEPWPEEWHEIVTPSEQAFCSKELYP